MSNMYLYLWSSSHRHQRKSHEWALLRLNEKICRTRKIAMSLGFSRKMSSTTSMMGMMCNDQRALSSAFVRLANPSTFSFSRFSFAFQFQTCSSGPPFRRCQPRCPACEMSIILGAAWNSAISLNTNLDSTSSECFVGVERSKSDDDADGELGMAGSDGSSSGTGGSGEMGE